MNVLQIFQIAEDLIYQIVVLMVLIPKTFIRVIADPTWARRYTIAELQKDTATRFDAYTSPALFWACLGIVPYLYLLDFLSHVPHSRVAMETEWGAFARAGWEQRFLVVVALSLAMPLSFAIVTLRALATPVTRSALRLPFLIQCYVLTPAFLMLLPAVGITLTYDESIPAGAIANVYGVSWLLFWGWVLYSETRLFRVGLHCGWPAAVLRTVWTVVVTVFVFIVLEFLILTVFGGIQLWSS